jgi:hypothetical protein
MVANLLPWVCTHLLEDISGWKALLENHLMKQKERVSLLSKHIRAMYNLNSINTIKETKKRRKRPMKKQRIINNSISLLEGVNRMICLEPISTVMLAMEAAVTALFLNLAECLATYSQKIMISVLHQDRAAVTCMAEWEA